MDYIKIFRGILEWEWWHDINTFRLFIFLLLKANWKDGTWKGVLVKRGSYISSLDKLAEDTDLTRDEVRTAIKHLTKTKEITTHATRKYTVFTVVNYDLYQNNPTQITTQNTDNSPTIPPLFPSREEKKEGKKERSKKEVSKDTKKKEPAVYFADEELNSAFADYVAMRKEIKKPMTNRAIDLAIKKLRELAAVPFSDAMDNDLAIQILNQSVMHCWQGLFPVKEKQQQQNHTGIDWSQV